MLKTQGEKGVPNTPWERISVWETDLTQWFALKEIKF